jgi:hypothetical protein
MIRKIHYIWLGSKLPSKNAKIVEEWKTLMPDFEIIEWSESDIKKYDCLFLRQCLRKKAFAFAADYLRLRIVNEHGGFYLDTDMKLLKPLGQIEVGSFMIGEQEEKIPNWGIFYSEIQSTVLQNCISMYDNLYFDQFKPPVIPYFLKDIVLDARDTIIYPPVVFYPLPQNVDVSLYEQYIEKETAGVHLWDFSWNNLKKERAMLPELLYRVRQLLVDAVSFDYPLYYFKINMIRIARLLKP